MNIAWFTPFEKKSAIGAFSKFVAEELNKTHNIDLWLSETADPHETILKTVNYSLSNFKSSDLSSYDMIFYNYGNFFDYHNELYIISQKVPGIVILHDYIMHHFFLGYFFQHLNRQDLYLEEMARYYGVNGYNVAKKTLNFQDIPFWETSDVINYPFIEKSVCKARGIIVHSNYHKEKISNHFLGPIKVHYLPFEPFYRDLGNSPPKDKDTSGVITIATLGHVNYNRCHDEIIRVLGSNKKFKSKIKYLISGPFNVKDPYYLRLVSLIHQLDLDNTVFFTGYLNDDEFSNIIGEADIFFNLRIPAIEGGSATVIEEMLTGKPVVVADTGVYAEIPNDCVIKVRHDYLAIDISNIFERLELNPMIYRNYGEKGKQNILNNCSLKSYVQTIEKIINEVTYFNPIQKFVDNIGNELFCFNVSNNMEYLIDDIANQILKMVNYDK